MADGTCRGWSGFGNHGRGRDHSNHRPDHDAAVGNHHHNLDDGGAEDGAQCLPDIAGDIHRHHLDDGGAEGAQCLPDIAGEDARPVAIRRLVFGMTEVVACRRNHLPIQLTLRRSKTKQ